ncbi:hypothetical protein C8A00DRAFT_31398 [Chaetomidium leptoderma]|uniref:Uncharacterized protein n=1 Tax=Chaetomidium leptoderma TaxID=669021 RepID=A0AAN6ZZB3_9PEZI|nr:hypothetical protein C8A00DRAFT_31398 [Chaetomidium leptoderma]
MCTGQFVRFFCPQAIQRNPLCPYYNPDLDGNGVRHYGSMWVPAMFVRCGNHRGDCLECPALHDTPGNIEQQDACALECVHCGERLRREREEAEAGRVVMEENCESVYEGEDSKEMDGDSDVEMGGDHEEVMGAAEMREPVMGAAEMQGPVMGAAEMGGGTIMDAAVDWTWEQPVMGPAPTRESLMANVAIFRALMGAEAMRGPVMGAQEISDTLREGSEEEGEEKKTEICGCEYCKRMAETQH